MKILMKTCFLNLTLYYSQLAYTLVDLLWN
jgi:hypothetical protein